jgi:hypothetical protein
MRLGEAALVVCVDDAERLPVEDALSDLHQAGDSHSGVDPVLGPRPARAQPERCKRDPEGVDVLDPAARGAWNLGPDGGRRQAGRIVGHAGIAPLGRDHLAEFCERGPRGHAPLELDPPRDGILCGSRKHEHLLAEREGDIHEVLGPRPFQALDGLGDLERIADRVSERLVHGRHHRPGRLAHRLCD